MAKIWIVEDDLKIGLLIEMTMRKEGYETSRMTDAAELEKQMKKEPLPELMFEQFYRVDESRDPTVRGTGLGLSIVRTLAERNDVCVEVESGLGKGSIFTVLFA